MSPERPREHLWPQRFEQVAKRFTFIAHDLKNLVSQLTLVLHHAERTAEWQFLRDAFVTVKGSVEKMQRLVRPEAEPSGRLPNQSKLGWHRDVIGAAQPCVSVLSFALCRSDGLRQPRAVVGIVQNIVQNALEATFRWSDKHRIMRGV
jgi:hypothetical protein